MKNLTNVLVILLCGWSLRTEAKEFPARARLLLGAVQVNPDQVNNVIEAEGLHDIEALGAYGVEISMGVWGPLDFGVRYTKRLGYVHERPNSVATDYKAELDQDSVQLILRGNLYRGSLIRADLFAGAGGANTNLAIRTASQDGELSKKASDQDSFGSFISSYGATLGIGYKWVYLIVEAGYEDNRISSLKRTGTASTAIRDINLSGNFVSVGLLFDGIKASSK
ncbi:MAG: hypothetical protein ACK5Y2_08700 [Bdellovibrionales bacterium]